MLIQELRRAALVLLLLSIVTGAIYPALVTGIAQVAFPFEASGSLVQREGKLVGSALIGQAFSDPGYFWSRPSATSPTPYNAGSSGGSNQGPLDPALTDAVKSRLQQLAPAGGAADKPVPIDLVTTSASGLDPHVTPAAAAYQVPRVAQARGLPLETVQRLVERYTEGRQFGVLGEPRVNVLRLNLALDREASSR